MTTDTAMKTLSAYDLRTEAYDKRAMAYAMAEAADRGCDYEEAEEIRQRADAEYSNTNHDTMATNTAMNTTQYDKRAMAYAMAEAADRGCYDLNMDAEDEDEATEFMNDKFPVDGAYWGRSEGGDWGLWADEKDFNVDHD